MLADHLARRGIRDGRVLAAFRAVPREAFVSPDMAHAAYADTALPIGLGQTISQPYVVALTLAALRLEGHERVLEVGTGSGYAAALLARLAHEVVSIERLPDLAEAAYDRLARLGVANVRVVTGDGSLGYPERAPYDAIAVAAGAPRVPQPLIEQLATGGRLVAPVDARGDVQLLTLVVRGEDGRLTQEVLDEVRFVPLIGREGVRPGEPSR
jgi:protein-L-isoaspartate(D-aspartate) O-methyltransferase